MTLARVAERERPWAVDWRRVGGLTGATAMVVLVAVGLLTYAGKGAYGLDFRDGVWSAGSALLHGQSPYPAANAHLLLRLTHAFVTPPPLAVVGAPFSLLPFGPAVVLWTLVCVGALLGALALLGVRDVRIYLISLGSFMLLDSLQNGQADCLLVLGAALAWRYRDSLPGGVWVGALIAAKLFALPLLLWLLVTRRIRSLAVACASTLIFLAGSWALIDFKGLASYPALLAADARAFETFSKSYSLVKALTWLGASESISRWLSVVVAAGVAATIVRRARGRDHGWLTATLTFGLLASPILWLHYLLLLFVPIAISRRHSLAIWLVAAYGFWVSAIALAVISIAFAPDGLRALLTVAIASALAIWSVSGSDDETDGVDPRWSTPDSIFVERDEPALFPSIALTR
jgi:hypothetical protein